jgi:ATP-dependent RNA helicase RhlB
MQQFAEKENLMVNDSGNSSGEKPESTLEKDQLDLSASLSDTDEATDSDDEGALDNTEGEIRSKLSEADFVTSVKTFEELELAQPLRAAIGAKGWTEPTPVQQMCLPFALRGRNVAGFAQTGTGKTGVFLITTCQKILALPQELREKSPKVSRPLAVILAPTRELAMQIQDDANSILAPTGITSIAVFGGTDWEKQARQLETGIDVIIGTPGRLKDFYQKQLISLEQCQLFICDEADRMFDMGFISDVEYFMDKLPDNAQKLMFSATTNEEVKELVFKYLDHPEYIAVNPESLTPEKIEQHAIICSAVTKLRTLMGLLQDTKPERALIFTNTKASAEWLHFKLINNGIAADVITGDLPQKKRIQLIDRIKKGEVYVLIATDVASRGLHIAGISHVFNFDLPDDPANYVHRIGRTARGGEKGSSYSLVCEDYGHNLVPIQGLLGEFAPKSVWHDPRYLTIEDKAGVPEPKFRAKTDSRRNGASGRDRPHHQRQGHGTTEHRRPHGENRPARHQRDDSGRPNRPSRHSSTTYNTNSTQETRGPRHQGHRDQQRSHRSDRDKGHDRHRNQRRNRGDQHTRPLVDTQAASSTHQQAAPAPAKTLGGLFKKLVRVFFGKSND